MECEWILLNQDRSRKEVILEAPSVPIVGQGARFDGKGYDVVCVVNGLTIRPDRPVVFAVEFKPKCD